MKFVKICTKKYYIRKSIKYLNILTFGASFDILLYWSQTWAKDDIILESSTKY